MWKGTKHYLDWYTHKMHFFFLARCRYTLLHARKIIVQGCQHL